MFHVGVEYADVGVAHENGGVKGVGDVDENETGVRALGAADEGNGKGVVAADAYASADGCVDVNDGG